MKYNSQPVKLENYVMKHYVMCQCNILAHILFKLSFSFLICAHSLSLLSVIMSAQAEEARMFYVPIWHYLNKLC